MRNTYAQQLLCDNAPETVALRIAKPLNKPSQDNRKVGHLSIYYLMSMIIIL